MVLNELDVQFIGNQKPKNFWNGNQRNSRSVWITSQRSAFRNTFLRWDFLGVDELFQSRSGEWDSSTVQKNELKCPWDDRNDSAKRILSPSSSEMDERLLGSGRGGFWGGLKWHIPYSDTLWTLWVSLSSCRTLWGWSVPGGKVPRNFRRWW